MVAIRIGYVLLSWSTRNRAASRLKFQSGSASVVVVVGVVVVVVVVVVLAVAAVVVTRILKGSRSFVVARALSGFSCPSRIFPVSC